MKNVAPASGDLRGKRVSGGVSFEHLAHKLTLLVEELEPDSSELYLSVDLAVRLHCPLPDRDSTKLQQLEAGIRPARALELLLLAVIAWYSFAR